MTKLQELKKGIQRTRSLRRWAPKIQRTASTGSRRDQGTAESRERQGKGLAENIVTGKCPKRRMEEDGDEIDGAVCGNQSGTRNHQTAVLRRTKITKEGLHERPNLFVYCKDTCDPRGLYYAKNDVDKAIAEKDEEIRRLKRALCRSKEDEV